MQNLKASERTGLRQAVQTTGSIAMSIVLFGVLSLVPTTHVNAQVECLGKCERQLALCLASGTEPGSSCVIAYEICVDGCLGSFAAVLLG